MKTKKVVAVLEKIAENIEKGNEIQRQLLKTYEAVARTNDENVLVNKRHYNVAIANVLGALSEVLGTDAPAYLDATSYGDINKANEIYVEHITSKKRNKKEEVKTEPKKRGRKPKND